MNVQLEKNSNHSVHERMLAECNQKTKNKTKNSRHKSYFSLSFFFTRTRFPLFNHSGWNCKGAWWTGGWRGWGWDFTQRYIHLHLSYPHHRPD